jgi:hypothetical protein
LRSGAHIPQAVLANILDAPSPIRLGHLAAVNRPL